MNDDIVACGRSALYATLIMFLFAIAGTLSVHLSRYDVKSNWVQVDATVVDQDIVDTVHTGFVSTGKVTAPVTNKRSNVMVHYVYLVNGVEYTGVCKVEYSLSSGSTIKVYYNPNNVSESVYY